MHAGTRESRLLELAPDKFEAWVRAEAEQGRANAEALGLLAERLVIEPKRLRIIKGTQMPSKIVAVLGV